jgi:hypothetical protein
MIQVYETAIRGWIEPPKKSRSRKRKAFRSAQFGKRVLVFDTETTTDHAQGLLYGIFRIYEDGLLAREGIFSGDSISDADLEIIRAYAESRGIHFYSRMEFCKKVFFYEVYLRGALCVGFNLPFDISRIAQHAGIGRGKNRRKFRFKLTDWSTNPDIYVEAISGRAAFIEFAIKGKMQDWEKPLFRGRFLDLSTLATAFTGRRFTLKRAAAEYKTEHRKSKTDDLGRVSVDAIDYGRTDVLVTWELYEKLRDEYLQYPFATMENERNQSLGSLPITKIYSTASVAKALYRQMGIKPMMQQGGRVRSKVLGYCMASYYGGRSEVRVRKVPVPVRVVDVTSMYPTVLILQDLQSLISAEKLRSRIVTENTQAFLDRIHRKAMFDPENWPMLRRIVLVEPRGEILPTRMRMAKGDPFTIAAAPFTAPEAGWYILADLVAAKILGGTVPRVLKAIEFYGEGEPTDLRSIDLFGIDLNPRTQLFRPVIEERQRAKEASKKGTDPQLARRDLALKILGTGGGYGVFAEINVNEGASPGAGTLTAKVTRGREGVWWSDIGPISGTVPNEVPGDFCSPPIATLVTGGARLLLAMLEAEVRDHGGVYAFCDTDSLAIVAGDTAHPTVPTLDPKVVRAILDRFNQLRPYDAEIVPDLIKLEYPRIPELRCFAISAKRYVLYTIDSKKRIRIVKASESGLGAIIGRTEKESIGKLARRIWTWILIDELGIRYRGKRKQRLKAILNFDVSLRHKLPISQPTTYNRRGFRTFNRTRSYDAQVKPFGFLQAITPAMQIGRDLRPIAPYERDERKSRQLTWTDYDSGSAVALDWTETARAGTVPVMHLSEYIETYRNHPEGKAAAPDGSPAGPQTRGVLGRLHLSGGKTVRIGKEVDRLDEEDGIDLLGRDPATFERLAEDELAWALSVLGDDSAAELATVLGTSERRLRDVLKGRSKPRKPLCAALIQLARERTRE